MIQYTAGDMAAFAGCALMMAAEEIGRAHV